MLHNFTARTIFLLVLLQHVSLVLACRCAGPVTLEGSLDSAFYGVRVLIKNDITVDRGVDINAPLFFDAVVVDVFHGCDVSFRESIVVTTGGNGALCGVTNLQEFTQYFLTGSLREATIAQKSGTVKLLSINSCQFQSPWDSLDKYQKNLLEGKDPDCAPSYPPLSCKDCPCGYFDGCNNCGCRPGATGFGICTKRSCAPASILPPKCKECPQTPSCPTDVHKCPDGSFVKRDPNQKCMFPPCPPTQPVGCPEDAKQCPDGTFVTRDPNQRCMFPPCPGPIVCPADTRLCPDGSTFVSRDPSKNCAFQSCPSHPKECGSLVSCSLVNLQTLTSTELDSSSLTTYSIEAGRTYSVECQVKGTMNKVTFTAASGDVHTEWQMPFWFNGDSNGVVHGAPYFQSCGRRGFKVVGEVWQGQCFEQKFLLLGECETQD